jgi:RecA-family ATPase
MNYQREAPQAGQPEGHRDEQQVNNEYSTKNATPREQIDTFVDGLFRRVTLGRGFASLRSFYDDGSNRVFRIATVRLSDLKVLADAAEKQAKLAASCKEPVVFCPPIAVFSNEEHAGEKDIAEGLALSVECDKRPRDAKAKLEQVLGPATLVVGSGGKWTDPETKEVQDKLHLHWRLRKAARDSETLQRLKRARELATKLVGGDHTNKPVCHPIRWPGSWHRKAEPTLCQIQEQDLDREIDLNAALAALATVTLASKDDVECERAEGDSPDWAERIKSILTGDAYHEPLNALAMKMLNAGMNDAAAGNALMGLMENAPEPHDKHWRARCEDIPRAISTAREKIEARKQQPPLPFIDMSRWDSEPVPDQEWTVPYKIPIQECAIFSGEGGAGKSMEGLHLCAAHTIGGSCWHSMPKQGPAIFIDAEDTEAVIHRRLAAVREHYRVTFADLIKGGLHTISLVGRDPVLATVNRSGKIEPTALYRQLLEAAGDIKPIQTVIASSANVFAGNENDRSQAQQFIGLLVRIALVANGSIILISHPSLTGINSGSGMSGTTGWHNAVRARFVMKSAKPEEGEQPDTSLREIEFKKNQHGAKSESVIVRFENGMFLPVPGRGSFDQIARDVRAEEIFLELLHRLRGQNRFVSDKPSVAYAPTVFAREEEAKREEITKANLTAAMIRLFATGKIWNEPHGKDSLKSFRIAVRG